MIQLKVVAVFSYCYLFLIFCGHISETRMQPGGEHDAVSLHHVAHTQLLYDLIPVDESSDGVGQEGNINNA